MIDFGASPSALIDVDRQACERLLAKSRSVGTAADEDLSSWDQRAVVYLNAYRSGRREHRFPFPLKIQFEPGEEGVIAFAPALQVAGTGKDTGAAVADLIHISRALVDEFAATRRSNLHPSAVAKLRRLRAYFT